VWCGACQLKQGFNYGCYHTFPYALDYWGMYAGSGDTGHGLCYPNPVLSEYQTGWYANPISLGSYVVPGNTPSSQIAGSVTPSYLQAANREYYADYGQTGSGPGAASGPGNVDACYMRFRHLSNTTCNILFCDGHVDSRLIGSVTARDICMNPK